MKKVSAIAVSLMVLSATASNLLALGGAGAMTGNAYRSEFVEIPNANPFFPHKLVIPPPVKQQAISAELFHVNQLILSSGNDACYVNGQRFTKGSQATVSTEMGKMPIRCERMDTNTVIISTTNGLRFELAAPKLREVIRFAP